VIRPGRKILDLTLWSIHPGIADDGYKAPEQIGVSLSGVCPERARAVGRSGDETHRISTTPVRSWWPAERVAETASGSLYRLVGPPAPEYAAWCAERGLDPLKIMEKRP
jgi:hypothetical protein